eukprot:CAMPEP_0196812208 /NCGR_PEP_ID=MMETSP1362-20130617/22383_1 /TAXON_ID=163516 /ORGANISM="Leptocylindrus danicus, Strain CCMP1856" /LENGTH=363 /DNA_ID=CAMNT_0042187719 /DNA_START=35 /DNA_END=1126 /DNA_ORIENTATION=-
MQTITITPKIQQQLNHHTREALDYLKTIKPTDGYTAGLQHDSDNNNTTAVILRRRNVALGAAATRGYLCIYHDATNTGNVVGIPADDKSTELFENIRILKCSKAEILVNSSGLPADTSTIRVEIPLNLSSSSVVASTATRSNANTTNHNNANNNNSSSSLSQMMEGALQMVEQLSNRYLPALTEALQNINATNNGNHNPAQFDSNALLKYFGLTIAATLVFKAIIALLFSFAMTLLLPLAIVLYCTCPSNASFEAKKELKRVLRGHHLPEDHPEKPKTWLEKSVAKIAASVTTELATVAGYEVSMWSLAGCMTVARVTVPSVQKELFWVGVCNGWFYVLQRGLGGDDPVHVGGTAAGTAATER